MTAPFGAALVAALKENIQGGRLYMCKGRVVAPRFFCCLSGTTVGVAKDPVAVAIVAPIRQCMGMNVNVDYSHSWSPSSTINAWQVDWGDGNVSNGVWPGPGSVNHPLGGYTIPATYTITLRVTDLLGAVGEDTVQVVIIDCTLPLDIEAVCGCGASGVWYTETGGIVWDESVAGILSGVQIYDVAVHPSTQWGENPELWAATEDGLYRRTLAGQWGAVDLPIPDGEVAVPTVVSVLCSVVDELETYALAYRAGSGIVWLYRTVDSGETWEYLRMGGNGWACGRRIEYWGACGEFDRGHKFSPVNAMPNVAIGDDGRSVIVRDALNRRWRDFGGWFGGQTIRGIAWRASATCIESTTAQTGIGWWDCDAWSQHFAGNTYNDKHSQFNTAQSWAGRSDQQRLDKVDPINNVIWETVNLAGHGIPLHVKEGAMYGSGNLSVMAGTDTGRIVWYDDVLNVLTLEDNTGINVSGGFGRLGAPMGWYYAAALEGQHRLRYRHIDGAWSWDAVVCPAIIQCVSDMSDVTLVGTNLGVYFRNNVTAAYERVCAGIANIRRIYGSINFAQDEIGGLAYTTNGIYSFSAVYHAFLVPPADGRHHIMDMSADGSYVYLALLNAAGNPVVLRVNYDFSGVTTLYSPGAGTWGGVIADYYYVNRVWFFGDFGAGGKVFVSDNWGVSRTNLTDAGWAANELVRPLLPNLYDPTDVIAILNVALDSWATKDDGITWAKTGDTVFVADCGVRDPLEPMNILVGRVGIGANHLQLSPNEGVTWMERSGGITANAPIPAMVIIG